MMERKKDKSKPKNEDYSIIKPLTYSINRYLDDEGFNIVDNFVKKIIIERMKSLTDSQLY
jgi:hypothetical protein